MVRSCDLHRSRRCHILVRSAEQLRLPDQTWQWTRY